jgi:hypothetical protein
VWSLTGNAGTTPGTNFLGTTDNTALELKVNGQRALRIEPGIDVGGGATSAPNLIGGAPTNQVSPGAWGGTISGGGVADPFQNIPNRVTDSAGTIGGGHANQAGNGTGTPGDAGFATVAGGANNTAGGFYSAVAGGSQNTASGHSSFAAGGQGNTASGDASFAAGTSAKATHQGSFVWADSNFHEFGSIGGNSFSARATGGFKLVTGINGTTGDATSFCLLAAGSGTWDCVSDRNAKEHFAAVDGEQTLRRLARIPIKTWNFKSQDDSIRHIGPMAQDFRAAFGLGLGRTTIAGVDADGVAFSAIQGLYRQNQALERQNRALANRLARLERAVARLSR